MRAALVSWALLSFAATGCGLTLGLDPEAADTGAVADGSGIDATARDTSVDAQRDTSIPDSGRRDAQVSDGMVMDGGSADAMRSDVGVVDGGVPCSCNLPNAMATCVEGGCEIQSCAEGFADCDTRPGNGCEADLSGPDDCGSCGNECMMGICQNTGGGFFCGAMTCPPTEVNCNGMCTNLATDPNNCGSCGTSCGGGSCVAGGCDGSRVCLSPGGWTQNIVVPGECSMSCGVRLFTCDSGGACRCQNGTGPSLPCSGFYTCDGASAILCCGSI